MHLKLFLQKEQSIQGLIFSLKASTVFMFVSGAEDTINLRILEVCPFLWGEPKNISVFLKFFIINPRSVNLKVRLKVFF